MRSWHGSRSDVLAEVYPRAIVDREGRRHVDSPDLRIKDADVFRHSCSSASASRAAQYSNATTIATPRRVRFSDTPLDQAHPADPMARCTAPLQCTETAGHFLPETRSC